MKEQVFVLDLKRYNTIFKIYLKHIGCNLTFCTFCFKYLSSLLLSPMVLVITSVWLSGMWEHEVSGGFSLLIFSCRPSADVRTGLE